jgi:HEAT repeat protein
MIKKQKIVNAEEIPSGLRYRRVRGSVRLNKYPSLEKFVTRRLDQKASAVASQEMVSRLIKSLSSKKVQVRAKAALELGHLGIKKGIPALCKALSTDRDPTVRLNAAKALGMIGKEKPIARNSGD